MNHTKEPWEVTNSGHGGIGVIEGDNHSFVAEVGGRTAQEIMANVRRIMLCVNACAGITNEALEKGIVLDSVKLHEAILDQQPSSFFKEYGVKVWEDV